MDTEKAAAETQDTAAQQDDQQGQAPAEAGKDETPKVDLTKLIEDDAYAEKVLGEAAGQPSEPEAAPEPSEEKKAAPAAPPAPAAPEEQTVVFQDEDGTEERLTISQARNRLNQAKHLARKWQSEIAPLAKVVRENPLLEQALSEAARGDQSRLRRMLQGPLGAEEVPAGSPEDEKIEKLAARLAADKRLEGFSPEEIKSNLAAIAAMQEALATPAAPQQMQQDFEAEARAVAQESNKLRGVLAAANPVDHSETMQTVGQIVKELHAMVGQGKISQNDFLNTVALYNDPRNVDDNGVPLFVGLYKAAQEYRRTAAAAKASVKPAPRGPSARLEPGAAPASGGGRSLPDLAGKSREERMAIMDSFIGV